jgi:anti-anti-sigma factor
MLEVIDEVLNDVLVIKLSGRLDGITSKIFTEKTSASEHSAVAYVVLECEDLNYISSEGLRVMLMAAKKAKALGGALTLASVSPSVNEVMEISGFGTLLGVHANIQDAIKAIKQ